MGTLNWGRIMLGGLLAGVVINTGADRRWLLASPLRRSAAQPADAPTGRICAGPGTKVNS